jgi:hypothetical protein
MYMRRPVKPFAVEVRRAGRRVPQSFIPTREIEEAPQPDYFTRVTESAPGPQAAPEQMPPRRVLQDLSEPAKDPLAERLQELESRRARRGRPLGSKNKATRTRVETDLNEFFDMPEATPAQVVFVAVPFKRRPHEQRFRWVKKKLRRGEHWKRRLPKILW